MGGGGEGESEKEKKNDQCFQLQFTHNNLVIINNLRLIIFEYQKFTSNHVVIINNLHSITSFNIFLQANLTAKYTTASKSSEAEANTKTMG
jgi:hypothetical protein